MSMRAILLSISVGALATIALALVPGVRAQTAAMPDGATLYRMRCGSCHAIDANRTGPLHRGVVGRRAASVPGYAYSPALRASNITWTPQTLDQWLQGPQRMVRGSRMFFTVANPQERAAIIAYLRSQPAR
ncbi:MAG: c-type cytochrome [Sphingomonadaceae bacterium]|nr:c-type cytochrome [Sphingomonadaceae bacterium]